MEFRSDPYMWISWAHVQDELAKKTVPNTPTATYVEVSLVWPEDQSQLHYFQ